MLLIFEYPAQSRSVRDKELQIAKARTHVARFLHQKKKKARARSHDPYAHVLSRFSSAEQRSLLFYKERTSLEWSGECDRYFWTHLVHSAAESYQGLAYLLISLATGHESLETGDPKLQDLSIVQGSKSIAWMNKHHRNLPWSVKFIHYLILTQLSALINVNMFFQCLKLASTYLTDTEVDEDDLKPLLQRVYSQQCQMANPLALLHSVSPRVPSAAPDVACFTDLHQARSCLEEILNYLANQTKSDLFADWGLLEQWLEEFIKIRDDCDHIQWAVLKAAQGMAVVQIKMLYSDTEMDHDQFLEVYAEVAAAYEAVHYACVEQVQYRFNINSGLLHLVFWAAMWCREPQIRSRLIRLLLSWRRNEGCYSSVTCGTVAEALRSLEESGIEPPPTSCADIPEHKRIRLHAIAFDLRSGQIRLDIVRPPYLANPQNADPKSFFVSISLLGCVHLKPASIVAEQTPSHCPDVIEGPAHFAFLTSEAATTYHTMRPSQFYFVLPAA